MTSNAKGTKIKKIGNVLLNLILVCSVIMIVFTILLRVAGNNPSVGGYMLFRVSSESMEPELKVGDVILTAEISDITSIEVGDVITYEGKVASYSGKLITHQVVTAPYQIDGKYYLVTQGVANEVSDPVVSEDQVVGRMIVKLPIFGAIYDFFITPWGLVTSILLVIIAFAAEFWHIRNMPICETDDDAENSEYVPKHQR